MTRTIIILALLALALVACGGGGTDDTVATPTPWKSFTPTLEAETFWTNPSDGTVVVIRRYSDPYTGVEMVYFYPPLSPEMAATAAADGMAERATAEAAP